MSTGTHRILALGIALTVSFVSQSALAAITPPTPGTTTGLQARVGQERLANGTLGKQWLVWKQANGSCIGQPVELGPASGFIDDVIIRGSQYADLLVAQASFEVHCGKNLGPVKSNGYTLNFFGRGGNDVILGGVTGSGGISLFGGDGDDIVGATGPNILVMGEAGNDDVEVWGPTQFEYLYGDHQPGVSGAQGADCLWDQDHNAYTVDCGGQPAGTQDRASVPAGWPTIGCEVVTSSVCCNWAHFIGGC